MVTFFPAAPFTISFAGVSLCIRIFDSTNNEQKKLNVNPGLVNKYLKRSQVPLEAAKRKKNAVLPALRAAPIAMGGGPNAAVKPPAETDVTTAGAATTTATPAKQGFLKMPFRGRGGSSAEPVPATAKPSDTQTTDGRNLEANQSRAVPIIDGPVEKVEKMVFKKLSQPVWFVVSDLEGLDLGANSIKSVRLQAGYGKQRKLLREIVVGWNNVVRAQVAHLLTALSLACR